MCVCIIISENLHEFTWVYGMKYEHVCYKKYNIHFTQWVCWMNTSSKRLTCIFAQIPEYVCHVVSFQNVCMSHSSPVIFNLLLHVMPQQKIEWTLDWIFNMLLGLKKDSSSSMYIVKYFLSAKMQHVRLKFRKIHSSYIKDASMKKGVLSRSFQNNLVRYKYK